MGLFHHHQDPEPAEYPGNPEDDAEQEVDPRDEPDSLIWQPDPGSLEDRI